MEAEVVSFSVDGLNKVFQGFEIHAFQIFLVRVCDLTIIRIRKLEEHVSELGLAHHLGLRRNPALEQL